MTYTITDRAVISIQDPDTTDVACGHLERGLLSGPRIVLAPGERLVERLGAARPLEVLIGPPPGEHGPVERVEPAHVHVLRLADDPDHTVVALLRLPRGTFHRPSPSRLTREGFDLILKSLRHGGRKGFFDGAQATGILSEHTASWPNPRWFSEMAARLEKESWQRPERSPFDDLTRAVTWRALSGDDQLFSDVCEITGKCAARTPGVPATGLRGRP